MLTKTRLWKTPSAGSVMSTISGKFILNTGRKMRNRSDMKHRVVLARGIESGVITERPFRPHLTGLDIPFKDEVDVGRNFDIDRLAFHELDRFPAQESGEENLIKPVRQRRGS